MFSDFFQSFFLRLTPLSKIDSKTDVSVNSKNVCPDAYPRQNGMGLSEKRLFTCLDF